MVQESMGYTEKGKFTTSVKRIREDSPPPPPQDMDKIFQEVDQMTTDRKHSLDLSKLPF